MVRSITLTRVLWGPTVRGSRHTYGLSMEWCAKQCNDYYVMMRRLDACWLVITDTQYYKFFLLCNIFGVCELGLSMLL